MKKAIYKIRDRNLPKQISDRIPEEFSGNSFIPPGWRNLVCMLDKELSKIMPNYILFQVKSKMGSLRYHTDLNNIKICDIIDKYERLSMHVCEVCGQEAKVRNNSRWITTRCKNHKE